MTPSCVGVPEISYTLKYETLVIDIMGTNRKKGDGIFVIPGEDNPMRIRNGKTITTLQYSREFMNTKSFMICLIFKKLHFFSRL